ncbi:MAG: nitrophenyl compound nitroreductase subunit ArsF family protein [Candidatus Moranbacteria bacterium]|nr:nitrophenyl compound nitroreductase subunit ArsF family protein [Candidatus Moranbacteria bacterium]
MWKKMLIIPAFALAAVFLAGCSGETQENSSEAQTQGTQTETQSNPTSSAANDDLPRSQAKIDADKVVLANFHGTQRCVACETVGEYSEETVKQRFKEEVQEGKVVFKSINGQLPENKELVQKYQARGSSLYINAIKDGEDNIKEDTRVWRLISSEEKFMDYLENEINSYLGE